MKIKDVWSGFNSKYLTNVKLIKKWIFWVALCEEAFFLSKYFNLKLTKLDKETIKVWFPDSSLKTWIDRLQKLNIWVVLISKNTDTNEYELIKVYEGKSYAQKYPVNVEDYTLTKDRILWLNKIGLEEKKWNDFLLKNKIEEIYVLLSSWLIKLPRKERYYFRDKIERLYMDLLEDIYKYMYNIWNRKDSMQNVFDKVLVIREFSRLLYTMWIKNSDLAFLDLWERWLEVLKISKTIINKEKTR